jgi:hypothetical protein
MPMPKWDQKAHTFHHHSSHSNARGSVFLVLALGITLSLLSLLYLHFRSLAAAGRDASSIISDLQHPLDSGLLRTAQQSHVACQAGCRWDTTTNQCNCSRVRTAICAPHASRSSKPCGMWRAESRAAVCFCRSSACCASSRATASAVVGSGMCYVNRTAERMMQHLSQCCTNLSCSCMLLIFRQL